MDLTSVAFPVNTPKFWGDEKVLLLRLIHFIPFHFIVLHSLNHSAVFLCSLGSSICLLHGTCLQGVGGKLYRNRMDLFRRSMGMSICESSSWIAKTHTDVMVGSFVFLV